MADHLFRPITFPSETVEFLTEVQNALYIISFTCSFVFHRQKLKKILLPFLAIKTCSVTDYPGTKSS